MSEFSISLEQLRTQHNYLNNVASVLQQCKTMVNGVNQGLGPIGIISVGAALDSIIARLGKHKGKCEAMATALSQIIRRYQTAESNIVGTKTILQMLEEMIASAEAAFEPIEAPTYIGAIYLVNDHGAGGQGHAAVVLLLSDGTYEYYSYGSDMGLGYLWDNITDINHQSQSGTLDIDPTGDQYSNYVFIPITDEQGDAMHDMAQSIYQNPGDYQLLGNNCNMNAQAILDAGGVAFAPSEFDMIATRPNTVYQNFLDLVNANPDAYAGYQFGDIPESDLVAWLNDENGAQVFTNSNYDYSVAHTGDVHFEDPSGWLADGLETIFGGTSMDEISSYWSDGWNNGIQGGVNFTIDHIQDVQNTGIDWVQEVSTSAIDDFQENNITGPFSDLTNAVIDGGQWFGNTVIDGGQWLGNTVIDGGQWLGNTIVDGAEAAWDWIFG